MNLVLYSPVSTRLSPVSDEVDGFDIADNYDQAFGRRKSGSATTLNGLLQNEVFIRVKLFNKWLERE